MLSVGGDVLRKIRAAICDEEELYCSRLAEYLQANQSEMVEACVCSQKKELKKLKKEEKRKEKSEKTFLDE